MRYPEPDETTEAETRIAVMVERAEKGIFDQLCNDHTWVQWRMFQEMLDHWINTQPVSHKATQLAVEARKARED